MPTIDQAALCRELDEKTYWAWGYLYRYQSNCGGQIGIHTHDILASGHYPRYKSRLVKKVHDQIMKRLRNLGALRVIVPRLIWEMTEPPETITGYYIRKLIFWLSDAGFFTRKTSQSRFTSPDLLDQLALTHKMDEQAIKIAVLAAEAAGQLVVRRDAAGVTGIATPASVAAMDLALGIG